MSMGNIPTTEQDQIIINELIELLNKYRRVENIKDGTIERLARTLLGQLHLMEEALCGGDITLNTAAKEIRNRQLKEWKDQEHAADILLQAGTMETEEIKEQLENTKQLARHMPMITCASSSPTINSLPKRTRTYLCVQFIVTWKIITDVEEMPRRTRVPDGEFHDFIQSILSLYGDSVAEMDADNLHKDILKVEEALRKPTYDENSKAKCIDV